MSVFLHDEKTALSKYVLYSLPYPVTPFILGSFFLSSNNVLWKIILTSFPKNLSSFKLKNPSLKKCRSESSLPLFFVILISSPLSISSFIEY